jgi:hypothetical protein
VVRVFALERRLGFIYGIWVQLESLSRHGYTIFPLTPSRCNTRRPASSRSSYGIWGCILSLLLVLAWRLGVWVRLASVTSIRGL